MPRSVKSYAARTGARASSLAFGGSEACSASETLALQSSSLVNQIQNCDQHGSIGRGAHSNDRRLRRRLIQSQPARRRDLLLLTLGLARSLAGDDSHLSL